MDYNRMIVEFIDQAVARWEPKIYRQPLVGFAAAQDPLFAQIKQWAHPEHLTPQEMLPGARSVVAWFVPFQPSLVEENRRAKFIARSWAEAYIATNAHLASLAEDLGEMLQASGFKVAFAPPTHNFDEETLVANWSHRHLAYVAGLGEFGLNQMLITPSGCAGRFASLVTDCDLVASERSEQGLCKGKPEGEKACRDCRELCPTGALGADGTFDRQRCWQWVQAVDRYFKDLGVSDVCGKCCLGRCAVLEDGEAMQGE